MSLLRFKVLHLTANGNALLEPLQHKEPIARKTKLTLNSKKVGEIFDTIANVDAPLYLAKTTQVENGNILECKVN